MIAAVDQDDQCTFRSRHEAVAAGVLSPKGIRASSKFLEELILKNYFFFEGVHFWVLKNVVSFEKNKNFCVVYMSCFSHLKNENVLHYLIITSD